MTATSLDRPATAARATLPQRLAAATGAAFVVLTFAGNSLTESALTETSGETAPGEQALLGFAAQAGSGAARLGLVMELVGFVCLAVFVAAVLDALRRRRRVGIAAVLAVVAATIMLAVKLGSGAPYIAGFVNHDRLGADVAFALQEMNGAAFVLCWLPFAVFVTAAAHGLRAAGLVGRVLGTLGLVVGALGVPAALLGVFDPASAMPVPFLLGCLWVLATSLVLAVRGGAAEPVMK